MHKYFNQWNEVKKEIDGRQKSLFFKERDVWWCSIGLNVGHEENGKNQFFTRPILIVRKFNNHIFFGVPLTTKIKENKYYQHINFKGQNQCAMLSQLKIFESKRLRSRMGDLPHKQFSEVKEKLSKIILGKDFI